MTISYHAHHSPVGADASFTIGKLGARGGFGIELSGPATQDIFVGLRRGDGPACSLPFFTQVEQDLIANFVSPDENDLTPPPTAVAVQAIPEAEITRQLRWATDSWTAPDISFQLLTPHTTVPDPAQASPEAMKLACIPAILARLTIDNSQSTETATGFIAIDGLPKPLRAVDDETGGALCGVAYQREWGLAALAEPGVATFIEFSVGEALMKPQPTIFRLGHCGGLLIEVKPGEVRTMVIALGFYREGIVTTGLETQYYYTRFFSNLEEVLAYTLANAEYLAALAEMRDEELNETTLNDEQRFLLAQATHSYYGNTQLLMAGGKPVWVVNEGEYQMMNTFDLTVDMLFFELRVNPWTMRNVLDQFVDRYSYYDQVKHPDEPGAWYPGGISFCHDMGVFNQFSPPEHSSYEMAEMPGCFSHMTHEQLTNWVLCAALYVRQTDDTHWLTQRRGIFRECLQSLLNRDGRHSEEYDGVMDMDSSRCGENGQEITTYDSLDVSLGQARNNLYLAGKTWAAYVCLQHIFRRLGWGELAQSADAGAARTAATITANYRADEGFIPAVFERGNASRIIPAIEGLVFPYLLGDGDAVSKNGRYGALIRTLEAHLHTVLTPGVCIDAKGHWWKMSSTSSNSWFSKVAISQFVARHILGFDFGEVGIIYDRAHADWQRIGSKDYAMSDQIVDGIARGSKYYPRGVSCVLWLEESAQTAKLCSQEKVASA